MHERQTEAATKRREESDACIAKREGRVQDCMEKRDTIHCMEKRDTETTYQAQDRTKHQTGSHRKPQDAERHQASTPSTVTRPQQPTHQPNQSIHSHKTTSHKTKAIVECTVTTSQKHVKNTMTAHDDHTRSDKHWQWGFAGPCYKCSIFEPPPPPGASALLTTLDKTQHQLNRLPIPHSQIKKRTLPRARWQEGRGGERGEAVKGR